MEWDKEENRTEEESDHVPEHKLALGKTVGPLKQLKLGRTSLGCAVLKVALPSPGKFYKGRQVEVFLSYFLRV